MVLEPQRRLGAGKPGSTNDMEALRKHPYFSSIYNKSYKVDNGVQTMAMDAPKHMLACLTDKEEKKSPMKIDKKPLAKLNPNEPILQGEMKKVNWLHMS